MKLYRVTISDQQSTRAGQTILDAVAAAMTAEDVYSIEGWHLDRETPSEISGTLHDGTLLHVIQVPERIALQQIHIMSKEGRIDTNLSPPQTYEGVHAWEHANRTVAQWALDAPRSGQGADMVDMLITWVDTTSIRYRINLVYEMARKSTPLTSRLMEDAAYYAGEARPRTMSPLDYEMMEPLGGKDMWKRVLHTCDLNQ